MENKRSVGQEKEMLAVEYLKEQGADILAQNFYFRGGELDIVAKDGEYLCFIEVKYRKNTSYGAAEEAVTAAKHTMPEYTTQPPQQTTAPTPTPSATTYRPSVPQEVIGTISPIVNPTSGPTGPGNPGISNLTDPSTITTGTKDIVSSEVLDTFGNVSGSLSDISGSKTNIPTSSSPILSSDGGSSNSKLVPLGAGLGAASLAGIGAKAYLDKREKSEEDEEDELETEEWASQDDMEIDYGLETDSEEADYLSPTDELAFTE